MLRVLRLLLCLLAASLLPGGTVSARGDHQPLNFERFGTREGLASGWVRDLVQDASGYLWVATSDGLCRYDGIQFRVWRPGDGSGLVDPLINRLLVDRRNRLWVGMEKGGLAVFDPATRRFVNIELGTESRRSRITGLVEDSAGRLWVGTGHGLLRLDPGALRTQPVTGLEDSFVAQVHLGHDGALWLAGNGMIRFDPATGNLDRYSEANRGVPNDGTASCRVDRTGTVWAGDLHGRILRLPPGARAFSVFMHLPDSGAVVDSVSAFHEDRQGRLWVGTSSHGLLVLDADRRLRRQVETDHGASGPTTGAAITCFHEDRTGVLWIGTDPGGLWMLAPLREVFQHLPARPGGLGHPMVRGILSLPDGRLLVATQGGGLHAFGPNGALLSRQFIGRAEGLRNAHALHRDRAGRIWVGGEGEIAVLSPDGLRPLDRLKGALSAPREGRPVIQAFHEDPQGRFWVGGSRGLYRIEPESLRVQRFPLSGLGHRPDLPDGSWVQALLTTRKNHFWVGTMFSGLLRFDRESGQVTHRFDSRNGLGSDFVTALHEDSLGRLWVATKGGGLSLCLDPEQGRFRTFGLADGLPHLNLYGILEETPGVLWISTDKGLCRFMPDSPGTRSFRAADGLQDDEFNRFSYHRRSDGRMFFGGLKGLTSFHPGELPAPCGPPALVLEDFQRMGVSEVVPEVGGLRLTHEDRVLTFSFAALDFRDPHRNQYAYRLEGFDSDWRYGRSANYTNLSPGSYRLRVRARGLDGPWNEEGLSIPLQVLPPWWQTIWARLTGLLVMVGLLGSAYRVRILHLRGEQRRLERLVGIRTREVGQQAEALAEANRELQASNAQLSSALAEVKTLQGLIPICAQCKKIRDDQGLWNQIESYLSHHTDARFSHGICPDCAETLYGSVLKTRKPERG